MNNKFKILKFFSFIVLAVVISLLIHDWSKYKEFLARKPKDRILVVPTPVPSPIVVPCKCNALIAKPTPTPTPAPVQYQNLNKYM